MSDISSQNTAMVTARNISFIADGQLFLDNISLSIASGTVTMVLGHNGAGKTLLLSALHGLIMPQRGTVTGPARQKQKMVFQKPVLLRRSARDYFEFLCPGLMTIRRNCSKGPALPADDHTGTPTKGWSQSRVNWALASQPDLLFLDEPTAHLDFGSIGFIESQITAARKSGTTIVMTSHNRVQAERLAEHVIFMENGKIVETASAKTFFSSPQTQAAKTYLKHY